MDKSILIVEDNSKFAAYLAETLREQGYAVEVEAHGEKAIYKILTKSPDLVILDLMLPGIDGQEICKTVRDEYKGKILMLTALDDIQNEVSGLKLGADDYVTKNTDPEILIARINALLRRQSIAEHSNELHYGKLNIDLGKKEVIYNNDIVELKPNEYQLLTLLAKNPGHVFSRNAIMQALRGIDYDGVDRTIDLRISYLRKKLGDDVKKPQRIKTVHGRGYVFVANAWD